MSSGAGVQCFRMSVRPAGTRRFGTRDTEEVWFPPGVDDARVTTDKVTLFLDQNLYIQTLFFYVILQNLSVFDFCRQQPLFCLVSSPFVDLVVGACLLSFPCFFLIYAKLGLLGPRGALFVSVIHPVNKNSSLVPAKWLTDDRGKWSRCVNPAVCTASGHTAVLKYSFLFHEESRRVFFTARRSASYSGQRSSPTSEDGRIFGSSPLQRFKKENQTPYARYRLPDGIKLGRAESGKSSPS